MLRIQEHNIHDFNVGAVLKVVYFAVLNRKRRIFIFTGLCIRKRDNSFTIRNYYRKEFLTLSFITSAPNIIDILNLSSYNFKFKQSNLRNVRRYNLISRTDLLPNRAVSSYTNLLSFLFSLQSNTYKERRRLRVKFRL